jgi:putative heme-binding domain-containing protein
MNPRRPGCFLSLALVSLATLHAQEPAAIGGWQQLFDGRSLQGWEGEPGVWSVHDGCIVGSTAGRVQEANTFLIWQGGELRDFELECDVLLEGGNNSGIQYRARRVDQRGFAVHGYQCDVHPEPGYYGMLYEEGGRGILAQRGQRVACAQDGGPRVIGRLAETGPVAVGEWHRMRVVARGRTLVHEVDGVRAVEVQDEAAAAPRKGIVALQVHGGAPMTVRYRNLRVKRLPTEEVAETPVAFRRGGLSESVPPGTPRWIWDAEAADGEELFLRCTFELAAAPASARLAVACDNDGRVYVNGEQVLRHRDWTSPRGVDVTKLLREGKNAIAVHGNNDEGPAALLAKLVWRDAAGKEGVLVTDDTWRVDADDPDGWQRADFDDSKWAKATVHGALGGPVIWTGAVGEEAFLEALAEEVLRNAPEPAPELKLLPGFAAERVLTAPRSMGSWVAMTFDDRGRIYVSDQTRGLYRITPAVAGAAGAVSRIEHVDVDLGGCQGLLFAHGVLYAVVNGGRSGLYRLRDRDGDDVLDDVECLRKLENAAGEHGAHAVILAPDGRNLLVVCGNHTPLPELSGSRVPRCWAEDVLLDRMDDPGGHAVGVMAPGGFVCRVDPDGRQWELLCAGFRNAYDLAVVHGDVFTFDSDMEWDMGMPWYVPTRICHVVDGGDFGWRHGSGRWPADYPDSLPPVVDIGPGSPTGVVAGSRARFPVRYRDALFAADWTFGTIYAIHLERHGASWRGAAEEFATGAPFAVADLEVGPDGALYAVTGGRGLRSSLYRITALAGEDGLPATPAEPPARVAAAPVPAEPWSGLGDGDPFVRFAARVAIERQPVAAWRGEALRSTGSPWRDLTALLALARSGSAADLEPVLGALLQHDVARLSDLQRIAWARVMALAFLRLGTPAAELREQVTARLLSLFPSGRQRFDEELCALLCRLDASAVIERAVPLLGSHAGAAAPAWHGLAGRNPVYGGVIAKMLADLPPTSGLGYANALRTLRHGFTLEQRAALLTFLGAAAAKPGGASYRGFVRRMRADVLSSLTPAEAAALGALADSLPAPPPFRARPPRGPGRDWTVDEAMALWPAGQRGRDAAAGRNLFHATGCAACHRFAGEGGSVGPDLTSLANKFAPRDLLEAILEPSKVISDQYAGAVLHRRDGSTLFGFVTGRRDGDRPEFTVVPATAAAEPVRVPADEVVRVEPSRLSPMPADLVDGLSPAELLDLVAFLLSRGDPRDPRFGGRR